MMILPLSEALMNCLQNLTSRIAGIDNEQMTNRIIGMGAMLGFGSDSSKSQYNIPTSNNIDNNISNGGLKSFIDRAKTFINPTVNLSDEKDYNGNINPIRNVISNSNENTNIFSNKTNEPIKEINLNEQNNLNKDLVKKVAKTGFKATKAYVSMGARMIEGDVSKSSYSRNNKNNYYKTEYENNNNLKKSGDKNDTEC